MSTPPGILFYVQHLLGTGHLRRAAALAESLAGGGFRVRLLSGGSPVDGVETGAATLVQLPPARIRGRDFGALLDQRGRPVDESWRRQRLELLLRELRSHPPAALIVEAFPFARRQMRFELLPLLTAARALQPRPLILSSVRDVIQPRTKPGRVEEVLQTLGRFMDGVLVHGDPRVLPLESSFPAARQLPVPCHYTGYVSDPRRFQAPVASRDVGQVLVSAGGGAVGAGLFRAAMAARHRSALADRPWRLLAGAGLAADDRRELLAGAGYGLRVEPAREDFPALLSRCAVSISQGGYNTVVDLLTSRAPAVVVPFEADGEREQRLRAERLAEMGLLRLLPEAELGPERLAAEADAAAATGAPAPHGIDLGGAGHSTRLLRRWLLS